MSYRDGRLLDWRHTYHWRSPRPWFPLLTSYYRGRRVHPWIAAIIWGSAVAAFAGGIIAANLLAGTDEALRCAAFLVGGALAGSVVWLLGSWHVSRLIDSSTDSDMMYGGRA